MPYFIVEQASNYLWGDSTLHHLYLHGNVGLGAIIAVSGCCLDLFDDVEAFDDFAEDGVAAVKEGCTAQGGVGFYLLGGEELTLVAYNDVCVLFIESEQFEYIVFASDRSAVGFKTYS